MTDAHFSSSVYTFFLVLLFDPLAMSSKFCQSSYNRAFKRSIKFWKSMKTLPVLTSSTSNFRSVLTFSYFCSFSIVAVFVWGLSFCFVLVSKIFYSLKTVPNLMCRTGVTTRDSVFIGNIAAWIIDSWNVPFLWQSPPAVSSVTFYYSWLPNLPLLFQLLGNFQVCKPCLRVSIGDLM